MNVSKIQSFVKQEWKLLNQLRAKAEERNRPANKLRDTLLKDVLAHNFSILLIIATAIATFGLLANSTATIIGAMIVAPLSR